MALRLGADALTEKRNGARKRTAQSAPTYDIDVVGRLDRVTVPRQQRSEDSLQRVLAALEKLLQTKAFKDISMPEVASKAGCSAATLYGRFKDKTSMLAALHESLRDRMLSDVDDWLAPHRWKGKSLADLASYHCALSVSFYRKNRNLLAAVLLIGDREVYERAATGIQHISTQFTEAVKATTSGVDHSGIEARVDLGVRAMFALLQQRLLFHPVSLSSTGDDTDATFSSELARLLQLSCAAAS